MTTETFASPELDLIVTSPTNPRKSFNEAKLKELAESFKATGMVLQPILLRPLPGSRVPETGKKVQYEIVCGERRYRASKLAGFATIPAMVRNLTDAQVLEIQLIENLQRDDLTEIEEAEGYQTLHTTVGDRKGLSADEIADRIGKSRRYVYNRLKLLDTAPEVQAALREGKIDASRALVIGTIRRMSDQVKALQLATELDYEGQAPSVRELQQAVRSRFFLEIRQIPWSETQGGIAGQVACSVCTKRSDREAEQDLFDQVKGPALCLDADCHEAKEKAHMQAKVDHWAKIGAVFKTRDDACSEGLLRHFWSDEDGTAILAGQVREDLPEPHTGKTIKQLLGKDAKGITTYAIEPKNDKEPAQIYYDRKQVAEALKAKGIELDVEGDDDDDGDTDDSPTDRKQQREEQQRAAAVQLRVTKATMQAISQAPHAPAEALQSIDILRYLCKDFFEYNSPDLDLLALAFDRKELVGSDEELDIEAYIDKASEAELRDLWLIARIVDTLDYGYRETWQAKALPVMLAAFGIDRDKIEAQVKADIEAEQKAASADVPAAPPKGRGVGAELTPVKRANAKKVSAKKLSSEEAELGIAAAMQGLDDAASADAVAPPAPKGQQAEESTPAAPEPISVGDRVIVAADCPIEKRRGKVGKVTSTFPMVSTTGCWVNFGGRAGSDLIAMENLSKVAA